MIIYEVIYRQISHHVQSLQTTNKFYKHKEVAENKVKELQKEHDELDFPCVDNIYDITEHHLIEG